MTVSFTVLGKPFGKQRHRTTKRGHSYSPPANAEYEAKVADAAHGLFPALMQGAVDLTILATFQTPKSWTKKKTTELIHRPHTQKPDADNIAKSIKDGLNGVAYADDSQVSDLTVRKVWGSVGKVEVFVKPAIHSVVGVYG